MGGGPGANAPEALAHVTKRLHVKSACTRDKTLAHTKGACTRDKALVHKRRLYTRRNTSFHLDARGRIQRQDWTPRGFARAGVCPQTCVTRERPPENPEEAGRSVPLPGARGTRRTWLRAWSREGHWGGCGQGATRGRVRPLVLAIRCPRGPVSLCSESCPPFPLSSLADRCSSRPESNRSPDGQTAPKLYPPPSGAPQRVLPRHHSNGHLGNTGDNPLKH